MKTTTISLLLLYSISIYAQFGGYYHPINWSEFHVPSCDNGFVQTASVPANIIITGSEGGCNQGVPSMTAYEITIPTCGTLTFDWNYQTRDCQGPYWDPFGYLLNDTPVQLTLDGSTSSGDDDQSGFVSIPVIAGDVFSFYILSRNNSCGESHALISKFNGPASGFALAIENPDPVYYGYYPLSCATFMVQAMGGVPPYTYEWSHDENTGDAPNISTACAVNLDCYWVYVTVTDATCSTNSVAVEIEVINVICEGTNKIELCHKNNTICVPYRAVATHLAHGDQMGACGETADCDYEQIIANMPNEYKEDQDQSPILNRTSDNALLSLLSFDIMPDPQSDRLTVFPNPASDKLYLSFNRIPEGVCNVSLVNTNGSVLHNFEVAYFQGNSVEIDISILPVGIYQVWVTLANGSILTKTIFVQQ